MYGWNQRDCLKLLFCSSYVVTKYRISFKCNYKILIYVEALKIALAVQISLLPWSLQFKYKVERERLWYTISREKSSTTWQLNVIRAKEMEELNLKRRFYDPSAGDVANWYIGIGMEENQILKKAKQFSHVYTSICYTSEIMLYLVFTTVSSWD